MKTTTITGIIVIAFALAACRGKTETPTVAPASNAKVAGPVTGNTAFLTEKDVPRFLRVTGQLIGKNDAVIAADAMGKVLEAPVERGSIVKAGDVLVKLDERQAKLALAEAAAAVKLAQAGLELAKNEMERNEPLAQKRAIADADFQKLVTGTSAREAEVAASVARRDMAEKMLTDCVIRAPFGGVVSERLVEPGEYVRADSPVARVVDLATLRLVLNVPETEVGALKVGQPVEFTTAAHPAKVFTGTLRYLGAAMREATRDLVVEAVVDNADGILRPGFFCSARVVLSNEKAVVAPVEALRVEGSRRRLFVVGKDQTLSERLVEVGEVREGAVEIRKGAASGETVLLHPGQEAVDGAAFQPSA